MKKKILAAVFAVCLYAADASAQTTKPTDSIPVFPVADSATYIGKYKYEGLPFEYMTIVIKENKLYFFGGEYSGFLTPLKDKKDAFDAGGEALFTFVRNGENKVSELHIDYQGLSYFGKRESR